MFDEKAESAVMGDAPGQVLDTRLIAAFEVVSAELEALGKDLSVEKFFTETNEKIREMNEKISEKNKKLAEGEVADKLIKPLMKIADVLVKMCSLGAGGRGEAFQAVRNELYAYLVQENNLMQDQDKVEEDLGDSFIRIHAVLLFLTRYWPLNEPASDVPATEEDAENSRVYLCPIQYEPLANGETVVSASGHLFARETVRSWMIPQQKNPMSNEPLLPVEYCSLSEQVNGGRDRYWHRNQVESGEIGGSGGLVAFYLCLVTMLPLWVYVLSLLTLPYAAGIALSFAGLAAISVLSLVVGLKFPYFVAWLKDLAGNGRPHSGEHFSRLEAAVVRKKAVISARKTNIPWVKSPALSVANSGVREECKSETLPQAEQQFSFDSSASPLRSHGFLSRSANVANVANVANDAEIAFVDGEQSIRPSL